MQFADKNTERLYRGKKAKGIPDDAKKKGLKLMKELASCNNVGEFKDVSGKPLEKLISERKGKMSVRLTKAHRLCFEFENGTPSGVEIVDYHNNP